MTRPLASAALAAALAAAAPALAWTVTADIARTERLLLEDSNGFRTEHGRRALAPEARLDAAAQRFAEYMARTGNYSHEADGRTPGQRVRAEGYHWCRVAENIAFAYDSRGFHAPDLAHKFLEGWKASPGHRHNLLEAEVVVTGIAVARAANGYYYAVQLFAQPCPRKAGPGGR